MQPHGIPEFHPRRRGVSYATSNAERQADFRRRHPDYNRLYKAKQRAAIKASLEEMKAKQFAAALAQAQPQTQPQTEPLTQHLTIPVPTVRLALPAPVVDPMMLELNALAAKAARAAQPLKIPVDKSIAA